MKTKLKFLFSIATMLILLVGITGVALAAVSTDQADYAPGSVVTISGDNSDGAGYAAGETVNVDVSGPNGYAASCTAAADDNGAWSCQVTLNDNESAVGGYSYTATGQDSGTSQSGNFTDGNAPGSLSCSTLTPYNPTHYGLQVGTTVTCTIVGATDASDGPVTVFIKSSTLGNTSVTGTASGGTITFTYTAPANGCNTSNVAYKTVGNTANNDIIDDGIKNDSGTAAAGFAFLDSNGNNPQCGGTTPKFDLTVSKTATPSFTRTFTWGITKDVDKTEIDIAAGGSATFNYTVNVTHDAGTDSAWAVNGTIIVANPNSFAVSNVDVTDAVDNGGLCTVTNGTGLTVPASGSVSRNYTCTYSSAPSASNGTNTATASWIDFGSPSTSATGTATFDFGAVTPTIVDGSVTVSDPNANPSTLGTVSYTDPSPTSFQYSHTFTGDPAGTCTNHNNTATFKSTTSDTTGNSNTVTVKVCVGADLTVSKTANPAFTRTYGWTIEKSAKAATIVPYLATGYKYQIVSHGVGQGFEQPSFNDSTFDIGDAGFGTVGYGCGLNETDVNTTWPLNTDILVRKEFVLPTGVTGMKISIGVAIDNDVQVFVNGFDVSGGLQTHEGCPNQDSFVFTVPDGVLHGGINLIAVRGVDRGVLSYLDLQMTSDNIVYSTGGGESGPATFTVAVTKDAGTDSAWAVAGTITVSNPNDWEAITADISDSLPGGTCSVTGGTGVSVPASGSVTRNYSCTFGSNPGSGTNTATAAWDAAAAHTPNASASGSAGFTFSDPTTVVNDSVHVTDTNGKEWDFNASGSVTYPITYNDPAGTCTSHTNTATITGGDSASATVTDCQGADLTVSKTANPAFKRTYTWGITKSVDKNLVEQLSGSVVFNYTVKVTHDSGTDSNWVVNGTITVSNPNNWEAITADLTDAVNNGGICAVTNGTGVSVPASGSASRDYTCTYASAPSPTDGTNTATAAWDKDAAHTPTGSASGSAVVMFSTTNPTLVDNCATVTDTLGGNLGTVCSTDPSPKTFTYSKTVAVPTNDKCTVVNNTATFETNTTHTKGSASQTVTVCGAVNGGLTMGFWQNKNGQGIITGGASTAGACNSGTWLRQYAPFQDLSTTATCAQVGTYVTNIIKSANASGAAMNAMLKGQMLATALDVYFSDPALGGNKINAPTPLGAVKVDLTKICKMIDGSGGTATCSGTYQNVSSAFGGATSLTVSQILAYAASQSNVGGSAWYGQVKATQELAKNTFDAINNQVAFVAP